jgi:hypothetical protein
VVRDKKRVLLLALKWGTEFKIFRCRLASNHVFVYHLQLNLFAPRLRQRSPRRDSIQTTPLIGRRGSANSFALFRPVRVAISSSFTKLPKLC